jgi:hypothetical protein
MKRNWTRLLLGGLSALIVAADARGQGYTNASWTPDSAGQGVSGGGYSNVNAVGQAGGVTTAMAPGGAIVNYAGFLGTFIRKPGLDTDRDGLPDELDPDNDNDALLDAEEIAGTAFNPATATAVNATDSDGDGFPDGQEAAAGTDPWNPESLLAIVRIANANPGVAVSWLARSNRVYSVKSESNLARPGARFTNTVAGGLVAAGPAGPPWFALTNTYVDTSAVATNSAFYRIDVEP